MLRLTIAIALFTLVSSKGTPKYRLPVNIQPKHYKLQVLTHIDDDRGFEFSGKVFITLKAIEKSRNVTLHSKDLEIDEKNIIINTIDNVKSDGPFKVDKTEVNERHDYYIMHLSNSLQVNQEYILEIPFSGELNKNLYGYYRSSYLNKKTGRKEWLAVTQFEPTHARMAFPCFDEPELKATFQIIIGHEKKYRAISNMPLKSSTPVDGLDDWVWDEFEESVPMSTYLVAYTVNNFGYKESKLTSKTGVVFRTWARRDALTQVEYAKEIGPKVLKFYEDYFSLPFPLPKMDQIAIPDFSAGAMENWGLVTYRETALLYEKNVSTAHSKQRVASVISHELAHQWFGNLVTMKWWTDLWLNEGFATYVASLGVEYLHPEWDSYTEETLDNILRVFKVDALKSSHPVSVEIGEASEISQIFDAISYDKGSCILRMMHLFLGEETFRKGITNYLMKHTYKNAMQDDLWDGITEVAHNLRTIPETFTVKEIMDSWTLQTGYPVITITREYTTGNATITQTRYLQDSYASRNANGDCWWVPLSFTRQSECNFNDTHAKEWLTCKNNKVTPITIKTLASEDEWVIFNIQLSGLYKIKYDERNWDLLIDTLMSREFTKISTMNRAQLIDDALGLAWTGDQDYNIAMRLIEYLAMEREYLPWKAALTNLASVNRMLRTTPDYENFRLYMKKILSPIYSALGGLGPNDKTSERLSAVKHKLLIASWACQFDVEDCVPKSQEYFKEWEKIDNPDKNNPVPLDLRSVVYCTAIKYGSDSEWQFLWQRYINSNVASEKQIILAALGCSREIWILLRYLEWSFSETNGIRKQDSFIAFGSVARAESGFLLARDFLYEHIQSIHDYLAPDTSKLSRIISPLADQMNTEHDFDDMKKFIEQNKPLFEKASEGIKRSLETIEINSQWKARNKNILPQKLAKFL